MTTLASKNGKARVPSRRGLRLFNVGSDFDQLFPAWLDSPFSQTQHIAATSLVRIDVFEKEDSLTLRAEVPGMKPETLRISLTGNRLVLHGEKQEVNPSDSGKLHYSECGYGEVERAVELPMEVDAANSRAHLEHGVLTIVLPKAEKYRTRSIDIELI
ncbi:MAG: Hsp20/alpha crystallin family protein [Planctomycetota bacterium]|nr:MAG: Hsp20/alpha crystallin family protein [Planctomycetota bacterium]